MVRKSLIVVIILTLCSLSAFSQRVDDAKSIPAAVVIDTLPSVLNNTSSLFYWQDCLWTINDHGGLVFYELDTLTAAVLAQLPAVDTLPHFSDMEETAQDDTYFYFGDFGNNHERLRDDLRILRLAKTSLLAGSFHFDTIFFTYEGYDPLQPGSDDLPITDYDCEAMIATPDSLYLFTKQWTSLRTTCYSLPNQPGRHIAHPHGTAEVYGLVTGACYLPAQRLLVFTCYSPFCQPFVYLSYDFQGTDFFSGEQLRLPLSNPIGTQIEAIATADGLHYYLTNEHFSYMGVTQPAQMLSLDLTDYLSEYLSPRVGVPPGTTSMHSRDLCFSLSPNPATDHLEVTRLRPSPDAHLSFYDTGGRLCLEKSLPAHVDNCLVDLSALAAGTYLILITGADNTESHTLLVK
jgi:hypothetical protein